MANQAVSTASFDKFDVARAINPSLYNSSRVLAAGAAETMTIPANVRGGRGVVYIATDAIVAVRFDGTNPVAFADIDDGTAGQGIPAGVRAFDIPADAVDIRFISGGVANVFASFYSKG